MLIMLPTIWRKLKVLFNYATSFCLCCTTHLYTLGITNIFTYKLHSSLEAQLQGTTQDHLQIFNIELKAKMKSYQMPEQVLVLCTYTVCMHCKIMRDN
jgi:hypothetical protein